MNIHQAKKLATDCGWRVLDLTRLSHYLTEGIN